MEIKSKTERYIKSSIFAIIFMALGALITVLIKKSSSFTISNDLDLPDLISIVVTIVLAFYVGFFVDKIKDNERIAKDTMISYYKEFDELLKNKISDILDKKLEYSKIVSSFKVIRARINKLNQIAISKKILKKDNPLLNQITSEVAELWRICTGERDIKDIKIAESIEIRQIKIDGLIYQLILEINEI